MADQPYRDPTSKHIEDWHWRPYEDVHAELGLKEIPDYIQRGFGEFMNEQAGRSKRGEMTPRDLIKAYAITRGSVNRQGLSHDTATSAGMKLPRSEGKVRPEGAVAEWLGTPLGQAYLKAAERGMTHTKAVADLQSKFAPFGMSGTLASDLDWAAQHLSANGQPILDALHADPETYRAISKTLPGIKHAKSGFISSLLGRGDFPTMDARQIKLHTGQPSTAASKYMNRMYGSGGDEAVERLASRHRQMDLGIDPALAAHYQHLAHHAVWDKTSGDEVTHEDLIRAMRGYADGGPVTPEEQAMAMMAKEKAMTAAGREAAGRAAAKDIKAQRQIKASEALGQLMERGMKKVSTTQADRTRVGGGNIGGAPFPAISNADPAYKNKVWGVMDEGTGSRLTNLTDPTTVWSTMLGSANQLKTNPVVFDKLMRQFLASMKQGNLTPELTAKINQNLGVAFGEGADIRDPKIWKMADTFEKRAVLADLMMGQGLDPKKGGVAMGGEKSGKGVIFKPTDTLISETEPSLRHPQHGGTAPTFSVGPRLFRLDKQTSYRPDLHPGFPTMIHGEDYGYNMEPVPTEVFLPEFHKHFRDIKPERYSGPWSPEILGRKKGNNSGNYAVKGAQGPGYYDLALGLEGEGLPSQNLHDAYIRHLIREGYAEGGEVKTERSSMNKPSQDEMLAHVMLHKADGGSVDIRTIGAEEAPDMRVKEYMKPAGPGFPVGGVDFQPQIAGQQMLPAAPGQTGQPVGQPGQAPGQTGQMGQMGQAPQGAPLQGGPPMPPFGQPKGPQSNILAMTPQGQAMQAMRPNPMQMPNKGLMPRMARGGSVADAQDSAAINSAAAKKQPIGIDALGDSTTYGWNHGQQSANNMISTAQSLLGDNVKINNLGIPSTTLGDLMSSSAFKDVLTNNNPIVLLNYGMNEAYRAADPTTASGNDPESFRANLMSAIQQLQDAGKKVILQTPNNTNSTEGWQGNVGTYANIISDVANKTGAALNDKYNTPITYASDDTIHPDEAGYGVLGQNLYSTINSVLNPNNNATNTAATTQTTPKYSFNSSNPYVGTNITLGDGQVVPYDAVVQQVLKRYEEDQKNPTLAVKSGLQLGISDDILQTLPGVDATALAAGHQLIDSGAFVPTAVNRETTAADMYGQGNAAPAGSEMYNARLAAGLDAYGLPQEQVAALQSAGKYVAPTPQTGLSALDPNVGAAPVNSEINIPNLASQPIQYADASQVPEPDIMSKMGRFQNKFETPSLSYQPDQYMFAKGGSTTPSVAAMRRELAKKRSTTHSIQMTERSL